MSMINWVELGTHYYRQIEVYDLSWEQDIGIKEFQVAVARYGGHVARLYDNRNKIMLAIRRTGQDFWDHLTIHNSAGTVTGKIPWNNQRPLVGFGWTSDELLVVVNSTGEVEVYDVHGQLKAQAYVFGRDSRIEVINFEVFENMLMLLSNDLTFYCLKNIPYLTNAKPERFGTLNFKRPPTCFKVIPPAYSLSEGLEILCGNSAGGLTLVQEKGEIKVFPKIPFASIESNVLKMIALSADGKLLGLYLDGGTVIDLYANFSKCRATTSDLGMPMDPVQFLWCGSDTLCTVYPHFIGLIDHEGHKGSMELRKEKEGVFCVSEIDGMRVFTTEHCEFWERVDKALVNTLSFGNEGPNDLLLAYEAYLDQDSKSVDSIRKLKLKRLLENSVEDLLRAACVEWDIEQQEKFLKASAFGKTFLDPGSFDANAQAIGVRNLRVLNSIRRFQVARPITYTQLMNMGNNGDGLIYRLLDCHQHLLAKKIAEEWKLKQDHIYVHWACEKLTDFSYTDEEMTSIITNKVRDCKSIRYTEIATKAWDHGRRELAIELLDKESAISRKVPLLLYMKAFDKALERAVQSRDPDLIHLVIMDIHEEDLRDRQRPDYTPEGRGIEKVLKQPLARSMLMSFARQIDEPLLYDCYSYLKLPQEAGHFSVAQAYSSPQLRKRVDALTAAKKFYSAYSKDQFFAVATNERLTLFEYQKKYIRETNDRELIDLSVCDTIHKLLKVDQEKRANTLADKFSVPEKKMWFLKLRAMAVTGDWPGIERLARSKKKPPIGFKPFANIAVQKHQYELAEEFIRKVDEIEYQVEMLKYIGNYRLAIELAIKAKAHEFIDEIVKASTDPAGLSDYADELMRKPR